MAFGDIKTEKFKFHYHKNPILLDDEDINNNSLLNFCHNYFHMNTNVQLKRLYKNRPSTKN